MGREKIKLSVQDHRGKVRYRKMYRGQRFISPTYDADTREARQDARERFIEWRKGHITSREQENAVREIGIQAGADLLATMIDSDAKIARIRSFQPHLMLDKTLEVEERASLARKYVLAHAVEQRLRPLVKKFITEQERRVRLPRNIPRHLSLVAFTTKKRRLEFVLQELGDRHIDEINEPEVKLFFQAVDDRQHNGHVISETTKRDIWGIFKEFIDWCCEEQHKQSIPTNLHSKKLRFSPSKSTPIPPTVDETKHVLALLRNRTLELLELAVLLHLNCGMYTGDIADLTCGDVDLKKRTLTYTRNKVERHGFLAVTYPLWERTTELLAALKSDHGELWLVNNKGTHLNRNSKGKRKDNLGKRFLRHKNAYFPEFPHSLMDFRKTAQTELREIGYADLGDQFLQHGSEDTTGKFYSGQLRERFIEGVKALEPVFAREPTDGETQAHHISS